MKAIERCTYTIEEIETGKKGTLHFDNGVTVDVSNKTEQEVIANLGHYGWGLVSIKKNGTTRCLFFERYIE